MRLCVRVCVCARTGNLCLHIPHHNCTSMYVLLRVPIHGCVRSRACAPASVIVKSSPSCRYRSSMITGVSQRGRTRPPVCCILRLVCVQVCTRSAPCPVLDLFPSCKPLCATWTISATRNNHAPRPNRLPPGMHAFPGYVTQ